MAISTLGVSLKYGEASPTTELKIKDFPSLLGKRSSLETTDLSCDAQTFISGIRQQSESFDFVANYDSDVYAALNEMGDTELKWSLTFSDKSGFTWRGTVSASVNEGSVDAVLEMTISVTPSSVPIWATEME